MSRLFEIKRKVKTNPHVFYGELEYKGIGRMQFNTSDSAKEDIEWLIKQVEQQQIRLNSIRFHAENLHGNMDLVLDVLNDLNHDGI